MIRKCPCVTLLLFSLVASPALAQLPELGGRIVFVSDRSGVSNLYVKNLATAQTAPLTQFTQGTGPGEPNSPRWSLDGRQIVFSASVSGTSQIFLVSDDGSGLRQLTFLSDGTYADYPAWHPTDPNVIFYNRVVPASSAAVNRLDLTTLTSTPIPNAQGTTTQAFDVTSDGSRILFSREPGCCWTPTMFSGYQDMFGVTSTILKPTNGQPAWIGRINRLDGWIAYYNAEDGNPYGPYHLYKMDGDFNHVTQLTSGNFDVYAPVWAGGENDGYIVFSANPGGQFEVFAMKADAGSYPGGAVNLTEDPARDWMADWTPVVQHGLRAGLVAYYPFNGNALDGSGNGNNGQVHGATATADQFDAPGAAFVFNGTSDFISAPDSPSLDITGTIAISAWVKLDRSYTNGIVYIADKYWDASDPLDRFGWIVSIENSKVRYFNSYSRVGNRYDLLYSTSTLKPDTWYHLVATTDHAWLRVYIDGVQDAQMRRTGSLGWSPAALSIGRSYAASAYFPGVIDDVRIYSRAFSAHDVRDLWELESRPRDWARRTPPTSPPNRWTTAMVFDEARHEVVLFGGRASYNPGGELADTWVWDGTRWTQKFPANSPSPRDSHVMVYDASRRQVVLFGGWGSGPLNDTWTWDGTNWTQQYPSTSPPPRCAAGGSFDQLHGQVAIYGGYSGSWNFFGDTWVWDGTNWIEKEPATSPRPLNDPVVVYDSARRMSLLFGGSYSGYAGSIVDETWTWDGATWTEELPATRPPARDLQGMAYDSDRLETVLFGGEGVASLLADTWRWDGTNWSPVPTGNSPPALRGPAMAYDLDRHAVVLFGGWDGLSITGDTWILMANRPTIANAGPARTVEASGPSGATVTLDGAASSGPAGGVLTYTWTGPFPEGGGTVTGVGPSVTLPVGASTVTLTVISSYGGTGTSTVAIVVRDTTPPVMTLPAGVSVDAASAQGASVTYSASAVDLVSGEVPVICAPQSGATFAIGTTTVSCFATDAAGNRAQGTFAITVRRGVTVALIDSRGNPISGATVQYYAGGWQNFGTTGPDGKARMDVPLTSYTFRMNYAGGVQDKLQNVATNTTVAFQTTNVAVHLKNSEGAPADTGTVLYYAGSWRAFGTTSGGQATLELLPLTYTFRMTYGGGVQDKSQNVAAGATVAFQTTSVTVRLKNSAGTPIDIGSVQYYAGTWRTIGTTLGGQATVELLSATYTFRMVYAGGVQDKLQSIGPTAIVEFVTTPVHSDSGTCTSYYASGWRAFVQDMELLPASYVFRFAGTPDASYAIVPAVTNHIR